MSRLEESERFWRSVAPWKPALLAAGAVALWISMRGHGFIAAALSGADLVFHEAGHPIFGLLGSPLLMYLGGAIAQLVFPVVSGLLFARRRDAASVAAVALWGGFSLVEIGRYAADGQARLLPLLAPDIDAHDWWNILGILGLRAHAEGVGGTIQLAGWLLMIAAPMWLGWLSFIAASEAREAREVRARGGFDGG